MADRFEYADESLHDTQLHSGAAHRPLHTQHLSTVVHQLVEESRRQFAATAYDARDAAQAFLEAKREIPSHAHRLLLGFSAIATAPITFGRSKKRRPRSRTMLFVLDAVRFGGTFAAIFIVLFVGINYQSFWQIAKADLALEQDPNLELQLKQITGQTALSTPSLQTGIAAADSGILSYLPLVGPPDNRLIIPKLGKNVPIVDPPVQALIDANWKQLEVDIQQGLLNGVVHYPGTAKPGQAGNFFLTGHSSYYPFVKSDYKDVFALLHKLVSGDTYSVYYGGDLHTYRVTSTSEVSPTNVSVLDQPSDKRISTLMTCTPVGTTLRRLVIVAQEIDPATGTPLKVGEKAKDEFTPLRLDTLPI